MRISDIRNRKTTVNEIPPNCTGVHESVLRAFQILDKVKHLLHRGTPADVILELIDEMEGN